MTSRAQAVIHPAQPAGPIDGAGAGCCTAWVDRGTDTDRDTGPVLDARSPLEPGGPPWRPWWVLFSSWSRAAWALGQLVIVTSITLLNAGRRQPAETIALSVLCGALALLWVSGIVFLALRPRLARRPTRPHVTAAFACLAAAGVIAVVTFFVVVALSSRSSPGALAVGATSVVLVLVLTVIARRLNDRAEAAGRLPARPVDPSRVG